jgi:lipopolysaccharide transport system ATP-binding protein
MSETVISVENLSKAYQLGQIGTGTLTNDLKVWWAKRRGKPNPLLKIGAADHGNRDGETIWALKDISFEVQQGEVLGIIGRNGAGKSTLLKILSRITAPTSGRVKVKGRIASLLEVGTGFHPDLTGRENIYLNGAILGMKKKEIARKFDEIVGFAEIEKFIDTPVKRYSSGMYVRLAFAVAAHLEPEILLVDEVLAVGDIEFQKKCLGKMGRVASEGRTVLFVSHNMPSIRQLCTTSILMSTGRIISHGLTDDVTNLYLGNQHLLNKGIIEAKNIEAKSGTGEGKITRIELSDENNHPGHVFGVGKPFKIRYTLSLPLNSPMFVVGLEIKKMDGTLLIDIRSDSQGIYFGSDINPTTTIELDILSLNLYPGTYILEPWFCYKFGKRVDQWHGQISIDLESRGVYKSEFYLKTNKGMILVDPLWKQSLMAPQINK